MGRGLMEIRLNALEVATWRLNCATEFGMFGSYGSARGRDS